MTEATTAIEEPGCVTPIPGIIHLTLFGSIRVMKGSEELRLRHRKARAVLACVALADQQELTRERLAGLLWSESAEEKARASLRQVVYELREALPPGTLRAERLSISLKPGAVEHDLGRLLSSLSSGRLEPSLLGTACIVEQLFDGLDDLDPAFSAWVQARRHALQETLVSNLEAMLGGDDAALSRSAARALLNIDQTHEEACRHVMLAAARDGDVPGALRAYEALWNILGEDFDMEPSPATQQLVAEIKSGQIAARPPAGPAPRASAGTPAVVMVPARMALLVENFVSHGVPDDRVYLVQGFRHDLIACLVRFREWFVLDGGPSLSSPGIMDRISSRYTVSTMAYQAGEGISLVLTLREAESGLVVWGERADLNLASWFNTQRELVRSIATSLKGQVSAARLASLPLQKEVVLAAHDRWLLGQSVMRGFRGDRYDRARQLFEESMAADPSFSPAYSSLAQSYNGGHIARPGSWRSRATEAKALELARKAVELDAMDSRAHLVLGWSLAMSGQGEAAVPHMRRATQLNPNDSWTLVSAALFHAFSGHHGEAQELADEALEMSLVASPTLWGYQVVVAYLRGDDEATIVACDHARDVIRTLPAWRAAALWNLGQRDAARDAAQRFFELVRAAWVGSSPATEAEMGRWLLHQYPFTSPSNWERLRRSVGGAGIPANDISFGEWQMA